MDSSRIGGGITEYIEHVADSIYNLWVQMMFVYYDQEHFVTSAGAVSGMELFTLRNDKFALLQTLDITVKEGSLVPKDPLTQRNEAIDLWSANAIDPLSLYKKLDFPDPAEATNHSSHIVANVAKGSNSGRRCIIYIRSSWTTTRTTTSRCASQLHNLVLVVQQ